MHGSTMARPPSTCSALVLPLLRLGAAPPDGQGWIRAAKRRGVPLTEMAITDPAASELYGADLVLVRPDGHVAWRGNACPDDPLAAIDRIRGAAD